jgi:hypothetical protein
VSRDSAAQRKMDDVRFSGFGGTAIRMHRAIVRVELRLANLLWALVLPLAFSALLLCLLSPMLDLWHGIFAFWVDKLAPGTGVPAQRIDLGNYWLTMHYPSFGAGDPSRAMWWGTLAGCVVTWLLTLLISPSRFLPLTYIIRACVLIQCTALAYFWFFPGHFPYDLASYLGNALMMALIFIFMAPWILGLTYHVFAFPLRQKVALTVLVLAYFIVAFPLQYLLHAYVLHHLSLLYLPLFYLVFGIFLDVMMFVALYSWGMSWRWGELARPK